MSISLNEINISLTVRSIVPNEAEIFHLVSSNDVEGIKPLFSTGLASPNDSYDDGQTVLSVCNDWTSYRVRGSTSLSITCDYLKLHLSLLDPTYISCQMAVSDRSLLSCKFLLSAGADPYFRGFTSKKYVDI